jgi:hypothetical protein
MNDITQDSTGAEVAVPQEDLAKKVGYGESVPANGTVLIAREGGRTEWDKIDYNLHIINLPSGTTLAFQTPIVGGADNGKTLLNGTSTGAFRGAAPWGYELLGNAANDTCYYRVTLGTAIYDNNPTFSVALSNISVPANAGSPEIFIGLGSVSFTGSAHTWTDRHVGFMLKGTGGKLYATQADGTTENRSSLLVSCTDSTPLKLLIVCNTATGAATYYYSTADGALTLGTTLTGNYPTGSTSPDFQMSVAMNGLNNNWGATLVGGMYTRT